MTEHIDGFLVTLNRTIRQDDADHIMIALTMTKGVLAVEPIPSDPRTAIAQQRAQNQMLNDIGKILRGQEVIRKGE